MVKVVGLSETEIETRAKQGRLVEIASQILPCYKLIRSPGIGFSLHQKDGLDDNSMYVSFYRPEIITRSSEVLADAVRLAEAYEDRLKLGRDSFRVKKDYPEPLDFGKPVDEFASGRV